MPCNLTYGLLYLLLISPNKYLRTESIIVIKYISILNNIKREGIGGGGVMYLIFIFTIPSLRDRLIR